MIVDHIWFLFYPDQVIRRIVWRTSFPLFLFLVWYNHSFRWRSSLWIYWIILQLLLRVWSAYWLIDTWYANILLAIWLTRVIMKIVQQYHSLIGEVILFITCLWLLWYTYEYIDYGTLSIVFALLGYWAKKYGNTIYVSIMIAVSICYHLLFIFYTTSFGEQTMSLAFVWMMLFVGMYLMSRRNYSLLTSNHHYNQLITTLSSYALEIYIGSRLVELIWFIRNTILWLRKTPIEKNRICE